MSNSRLDLPKSDNTVRIRMVDTTVVMSLHAVPFIKPVVPGHELMNMTDMAFLIENERLGTKAMFDLGVRKDYWNLPPSIQNRFDRLGVGLRIDKDVRDILKEKAIPIESINDIIWSHTHWDHTGDTTLFPPTTNLVYGPDVSSIKPGYPDNPKAPVPNDQFTGRKNIEIDFPAGGLEIGGFPAHDFYGDGSFYLLSTPGHAKGHLCALARTTPDTFILMGGDSCHFAGDLRPNKGYPMPNPIPEGQLDNDPALPNPCPASFFLDEHPQRQNAEIQSSTTRSDMSADDFVTTPKEAKRTLQPNQQSQSLATTPYYLLSTDAHTAYDTPSPVVAQETVNKLSSSFDAKTNVFVALAHDTALVEHLPTLNESPDSDLNEWYAKGWKEKCYWGWLNQVARKGKNGRSQIVDGWWCGGKRYETAKEMLDTTEKHTGSSTL